MNKSEKTYSETYWDYVLKGKSPGSNKVVKYKEPERKMSDIEQAQYGRTLSTLDKEEKYKILFDWIMGLSNVLKPKKQLTADDIKDAIEEISTRYYFIKDTELIFIARWVKQGQAGTFYNQLLTPDILDLIHRYDIGIRADHLHYYRDEKIMIARHDEEREKKRRQIRENQKQIEQSRKEAKSIAIGEYLRK